MGEQHPLLKRALQQPPQPFNMGGVSGFQDEVYHKKFRHSGRKDSNEPTSTQESGRSPSPGPASHSILASQLAAPPSYSQPSSSASSQNGSRGSSSVLASTLSRPPMTGAKESEQRNEWLANSILERRASPSQSGSLLMCAPSPAHSNNIPAAAGQSGWASGSGADRRHIPVPVAPTGAGQGSGGDSQPLNLSPRTPPPADIPTEA